jgi:hypothetical protein
MERPKGLPPAILERAKAIDEASAYAVEIYSQQGGSFAQELALAQSVTQLRELLTPDVMQPVLALMNTDLGFATDRDPKKAKNPVQPYGMETVRECFIESKLRGFHSVGNEWNIIAGKFYACQGGFKRKVRELTGGTFEHSFDVPVWSQQQTGKTRVKARATWTYNGKKADIGVRPEDPCELVVKVNEYMGDDGVLGKALRKLLKLVYERITGQSVNDGDANEANSAIDIDPAPAAAEPTFGQPEASASTGAAKEAQAPAPATASSPKVEPTKTAPFSIVRTPHEELYNVLSENGVAFDDFRMWADTTGRLENADSFGSIDDLPSEFVVALLGDPKALKKVLTLHGTTKK